MNLDFYCIFINLLLAYSIFIFFAVNYFVLYLLMHRNGFAFEYQDGDERSGDERWDALLRKTRAFLESYAFIRQGCADVTDVGLCGKCKKKDDYDLLLCTTSFCLVAVHKHCLGYMPAMKGRFYCAFCSYAHLLSQLEDIEKEMGVARNNIATFLGKENDSDEDCDAKNILIPSEDKTKEESSRKKVRHGR